MIEQWAVSAACAELAQAVIDGEDKAKLAELASYAHSVSTRYEAEQPTQDQLAANLAADQLRQHALDLQVQQIVTETLARVDETDPQAVLAEAEALTP